MGFEVEDVSCHVAALVFRSLWERDTRFSCVGCCTALFILQAKTQVT